MRILKLWKENKINKSWYIGDGDLIKRFKESKYSLLAHPVDFNLRLFICDKDGLNSVFNESGFEKFLIRNWKELTS